MKTEERGKQFVRQWKILKLLESLHYGSTAEDMAHALNYSKRTRRPDAAAVSAAVRPAMPEPMTIRS